MASYSGNIIPSLHFPPKVASRITDPERDPAAVAIIVGALLTVAVMAVRDGVVQPFAIAST
jgi:hypothetical protein